jgi:hypothetical protein
VSRDVSPLGDRRPQSVPCRCCGCPTLAIAAVCSDRCDDLLRLADERRVEHEQLRGRG